MKRNRNIKFLIVLAIILLPVLGLKAYFEIDNVIYEKRTDKMNAQTDHIESLIEQNTLKTDFIQHTIDWYKGENIEGGMVMIWGAFLLIMSLYFYITDKFESTNQLIIPLLIAGLIWFSAASFGFVANKNRLEKAKIEYQQNREGFVENEKVRVANYLPTYKYLLIGWSIAIVIGLVLFNFTHNSLARAIGLSLILFSIMGLIVDLTSEQNAIEYYKQIQQFKLSESSN